MAALSFIQGLISLCLEFIISFKILWDSIQHMSRWKRVSHSWCCFPTCVGEKKKFLGMS